MDQTSKQVKAALKARILSHTVRDGECWIWVGGAAWSQARPDHPYGVMELHGKRVTVRRLVYELWGRKPKLDKHVVVGTCGNSLCVNPGHLQLSCKGKGGRPPVHRSVRPKRARRT